MKGGKYREESWSWKHNSRRMKTKASNHGKAFFCLSSPTAPYLDHKVCLSILLSVFFPLPSLSPVSYPSYLFSSAFFFFPHYCLLFYFLFINLFIFSLPLSSRSRHSTGFLVFSVTPSRKFQESIITSCQELTCTQLIIITYHQILTYPQLVITC